MNGILTFTRKYAVRLTALVLILAAYFMTRLPDLSRAERAEVSRNFQFQRLPLPEFGGGKTVRQVNPSLHKISAWISSVGAAVALNDLDEDGLPNDVCYVDPRIDQVVVAPVPGSPTRYQPFSLDAGLFFDSRTMAPMGSILTDFNEDGLTDVLVYYWGRTPVVFLRKHQEFSGKSILSERSYVASELVEGGERWYTNAVTVADLDGDGHLDLVIGNYFQDGARVLDSTSSEPVQMQHSMSRAFNGGRNRLLRWTTATSGSAPTVSFKLVEGAIEDDRNKSISTGWTLALAAGDLDGDLMPEIYFANDFGPDRLLHNRLKPGQFRFVPLEGRTTFTTPGSKVLGRDSFKGMGVDFGDLNGDGLVDIYVSNIAGEYALEESHFAFINTGEIAGMWNGVAPFVDQSETLGLSRSGWAWDVKLGDFNNDGALEVVQAAGFIKGDIKRWPELHELAMGNDQALQSPASWPRFQPGDALSDDGHNPFYVLIRNRFYDLARELDLADSMISRGIATADVDGDGNLDFALANQWETSYFFHNKNSHPGSFLGLHLRLPVSEHESEFKIQRGHSIHGMLSRPAIGATVNIRLPDGKQLVAQTDTSNGHSGKRSPDLLFGLGTLAQHAVINVSVHWRDQHGNMQNSELNLSPGWYTVLLGSRDRKTQ